MKGRFHERGDSVEGSAMKDPPFWSTSGWFIVIIIFQRFCFQQPLV